jgi:hypothetical protein
MSRIIPLIAVPLVAVLALWLTGCADSSADIPVPKPDPLDHPGDDHAHKPSAHGGIIVPVGRHSYHAEAVFEKGGTLRLYLLGQDEAQVQETEAKPVEAFAKVAGEPEAEKFVLTPDPQPGDQPGMTSRFVGQLPLGAAGKDVEVTIPNLTVGGGRFRVGFRSVSPAGHAEAGMPTKLGTDEERAVFFTPGGKYTPADIAANGDTVPSAKYRGLKAKHDDNPKPGEKVCPVSGSKADPRFTWIVGGQTYEFCCVPCVEELVGTAKEKPAEIKDPESYRKK